MSSSVWKFICGILASIVLTGAATVHQTTGNYATKAELSAAVAAAQTQASTALAGDHELIKETRDDVKDLQRQIDQLSRQVGEVEGMMRARR